MCEILVGTTLGVGPISIKSVSSSLLELIGPIFLERGSQFGAGRKCAHVLNSKYFRNVPQLSWKIGVLDMRNLKPLHAILRLLLSLVLEL